MICLDTSFIIDLLNSKDDAIKKYNSIKHERLTSTDINYFEILFGVFKKSPFSNEELYLVEEFFNFLNILLLDHPSAYKAAEIASSLFKKGLDVGVNDSLIAGICMTNNCKLITKDAKHFSRIKGLKVESY